MDRGATSSTPPTPVDATEVQAGADRIRGHVRRTPTIDLEAADLGLSDELHPVRAKLDLLQVTGSFKARGATALLTATDVPEAGVVAASGGNFASAIAWAARRLGHRATVVVPASSPREKIDPIRELGAEVVVVDGYYADALAVAEERVASTGALTAHAYDQRDVVAGQGTALLELSADGPIDTLLVACGGGGLLAGCLAVAEGVRVVAVETPGTAALHAALAAGAPVDVEVGGIAASSLGARRIGDLAWAAVGSLAGSVTVEDGAVVDAQRQLWRATRLVAEPGGAAALAALTSGAYEPAPDERVGVLVCGGNTDPPSGPRRAEGWWGPARAVRGTLGRPTTEAPDA